jgi:hypothetical protein
MLKWLAFLYRAPGVLFAAIFLVAGAYFGSSRDFGSFLFSIPTLGAAVPRRAHRNGLDDPHQGRAP